MEQPPPIENSPVELEPPAAMSLPARLANVIADPGEVFEQVRRSGPSVANWLVPALLAILVGWAGAVIIFSQDSIKHQMAEMTDKAIDQQIAKMNLPPDQAEKARETAARYGSIGQKVSIIIAPVAGAFISPFMWGLIIWLVGTKVFKGSFPYMKGVEVVGLSNMISVLEGIVKTLLIVAMGSLWAAPSLGLLVTDFDPQKPSHAAFAAINIMTFWLLGVRASGLARLSGATFAKSALWVFGIWLFYTALMMGIGFAMQAAFSPRPA